MQPSYPVIEFKKKKFVVPPSGGLGHLCQPPEGGTTNDKIAILIPCYNEEMTVAEVVRGFKRELPLAEVYVFDNASTDLTAQRASESGAIVRREERRGKGYVVQAMFRQVEADVYVMVDGDGTYHASEIHRLVEPILRRQAEMVVGARWMKDSRSKARAINLLGNRLFRMTVNALFGVGLNDVLSGYRAFSREFVKRVKLTGGGFETEVELTIKAEIGGWRVVEIPIGLAERPSGSHSKIRALRDGMAILGAILALFRRYRTSPDSRSGDVIFDHVNL
jgi:glycosyltransferase involved in cell wall biosynthesis